MESLKDEDQLRKFKSRIKLWGKIQVILAIAAASVTIIIVTQISPLIQKKHKLESEIATLEAKIKKLNEEIDYKTSTIKQLVPKINNLETDVLKPDTAAMKSLISPQAEYNTISKGVHLFRVFIKTTDEVKANIAKVEYFFDHPSFVHEKTLSSQNAQENFKVEYKGYGCLDMVKITVFPKQGPSFPIYFDMCAKLGPEWQ